MYFTIIFLLTIVVVCSYRFWCWRDKQQRDADENNRGEFVVGNIALGPDYIVRRGEERRPLMGISAAVESIGQLQRRITATRLATLGPFALAMQKKQDNRELYVTVAGPDFAWLLQLPPEDGHRAREFVLAINQAGQSS